MFLRLSSRLLPVLFCLLAAFIGFMWFLTEVLGAGDPKSANAFTELGVTSTTVFGVLAILAGVIIGIFPVIYILLHLKRYFSHTGREFQRTILEEWQPIPEELLAWEEELGTLGFKRLGNFHSKHEQDTKMSFNAWVFVDETGTIYVEMAQSGASQFFIEFETDYAENFTLCTAHNILMEFETPYISIRTVNQSVGAAYDYHLTQKRLFDAKRGEAKQIRKLEDIFNTPEEKVQRHRSMDLSMMRLYGGRLLGYLAYILVGATAFLLIPILGGTLAAATTAFLLGLAFWRFQYDSYLQAPFKAVEERKPRKAAA